MQVDRKRTQVLNIISLGNCLHNNNVCVPVCVCVCVVYVIQSRKYAYIRAFGDQGLDSAQRKRIFWLTMVCNEKFSGKIR